MQRFLCTLSLLLLCFHFLIGQNTPSEQIATTSQLAHSPSSLIAKSPLGLSTPNQAVLAWYSEPGVEIWVYSNSSSLPIPMPKKAFAVNLLTLPPGAYYVQAANAQGETLWEEKLILSAGTYEYLH